MAKNNSKKIIFRCKKCLQDIEFDLNLDSVQKDSFPYTLNSIHGAPSHNLIVQINNKLKVESFEIVESIDQNNKKNEDISRKVLRSIDLSEEEIEIFLNTSGKGPISLGEIAILGSIPMERAKNIAGRFLQKGLFKEIQGATIYYQALPPYAALIDQLEKFTQMIRGIQISTPTDLHTSFLNFEDKAQGVQNLLDFVKYLSDIKMNLSKDISDQRDLLDESLVHLQNQQKIVTGINSLRDQSIGLVDEHYISLFNQFELLKQKISKNLQKLQLGVIVKTVEDIVQKSIDTQMEKIRDDFQKTFESKFKYLLDQLTKEIGLISENAGKVSSGLQNSFSTVLTQFDDTLSDTQDKILNISDSVMGSFGMLKNTFSEKVVITLDDILGKIVDQLDMNISSIKEFWEVSKGSINFTMKDVWFVRTPEGMIAQLDDGILRAKMRLLILAPSLSDIDIEPFKKIRNHINVRICCNINKQDKNQKEKLAYFDSRHNIDYRHRKLKNLWAINRDYEEIILGIVNSDEKQTQSPLEVAGIGSILPEHIKIFVPILEDAWRNSSKNLPDGFPVTEIAKFVGKKPNPLIKSKVLSNHPIMAEAPVSSGASAPPIVNNVLSIEPPESHIFTSDADKRTLSSAAIKSMRETFEDTPEDKNQSLSTTSSKNISQDKPPQNITKNSSSNEKSFIPYKKFSEIVKTEQKVPKKAPSSIPVVDPFSPALKYQQQKKKEELEKPAKPSMPIVDPFSPALKFQQHKKKQELEKQTTPSMSIGDNISPASKINPENQKNKLNDNHNIGGKTGEKLNVSNDKEQPKKTEKVDEKKVKIVFNNILKSLDETKIDDTILGLEQLYGIAQKSGISSKSVSDICTWRDDLRRNAFLDDFKKKILTKRLKIWKNKLLEVEK
ncbi:hypothetical protein NEF87_000855 [Candidatus Lokiarchaeum ossiferum]|uniref:Transcription regulator TrmB N-terminal domain-containing protein n=1 Tax=Candidatus Lokiarchaeum ossiferum TaxID=2951803 RepID=A0ABY6HMF9_9ARCH|nr:hypothetical protein NEF87_000855 [Candidatus Lokiarchaeum sp. B-35]